ncbi:fimbrial protein [Serratia fonticola]|uniref:Fimbrial protein n=1 Tax=Serratia fonticola TaxID=47917 RepID=A0AAE7EKX8_SERFO|nr:MULTISPECIES: fimbrial protein [Serratia]MDQ9127108.1 fimbrial protein [Serratia fonticola]QKJ60780.1 type 1 fimbrial protein [Serratia fonticola]
MKWMQYIVTLIMLFSNKQAYADVPMPGNCNWESEDGKFYATSFEGTINLGTLYIPRDAPVGSIIGQDWVNIPINTSSMKQLACFSKAAITTMVSGGTVINNITVANNRVPTGSLFSTNIPGVGIAFKTSSINVSTVSGTPPYFPYTVRTGRLSLLTTPNIPVSVLLVKTADISMGLQKLNASSQIITDGTGVIEKFKVNATIIRSECVLPVTSKQISVYMGNISISKLKPAGTEGSTLQSFQIPLTDCISGSYPSVSNNYFTSSYVNLSLSGNSGSTIIDVDKGILGLNSKSTAKGVAVQILQAGSNIPMTLGRSVKMKRVTDGSMSLDFDARYIKTNDSPTAGSANASATFTITYK